MLCTDSGGGLVSCDGVVFNGCFRAVFEAALGGVLQLRGSQLLHVTEFY